jgi:cyclic-di-GMP phosphodiesterase, flagellum assembly factor TipF
MAGRRKASGKFAIIDVVVLVAMAIAAIAFALGLAVHSPIDLTPAVIAGAALFLVMASSHLVLVRSFRSQNVSTRMDELAEAVDFLAADTRIDQVQDDVARLELLGDRIERLDRVMEGLEGMAAKEGMDRLDALYADVERLRSHLDDLRDNVEGEARAYREKVTDELRLLESLIKQLAVGLAGAPSEASGSAEQEFVAAEAVEETVELAPLPEPAPDEAAEDELLETVRQAIEADRIDLHLQPILTLPERKISYYEALTRLRDRGGQLLMPRDFLPVAEAAGMMPLVDNVMLVKSVQALQRLEAENGAGLFCNLSRQSLLDPDFFPQFLEFMEQNSDLRDSLFFEFSQPELVAFGPVERGSLNALAELGFRFSLDHVEDLDIDFADLRDRAFRFIKVDCAIFLGGMAEAGAHIHAEDMRDYLQRYEIELVVEKIDDEDGLAQLSEYGVRLGQGYLLGEPRDARAVAKRSGEAGADANATA